MECRANSRADFYLVLYKVALIIVGLFLPNDDCTLFAAFGLTCGAAWIYYQCKSNRPLYNDTLQQVWNITNAMFLFAMTSMLVSVAMHDAPIFSGVHIMIMGLPIIGFIEYYSTPSRVAYLSQRFDALHNPDHSMMYLRYLCEVVRAKHDLSSSTSWKFL